MFNIVNSEIKITSQELVDASKKYEKVLRSIAVYSLAHALQHMTTVEGVRGQLTWGELQAKSAWALYKKNDDKNNDAKITGRSLETHLLSLIDTFDPNEVAGTIFHEGPNSGDALKTLPITVQVMARKLREASEQLYYAMFKGAYTPADGKTPMTSITGFDTILDQESAQAAGENPPTPLISTTNGNLLDLSDYKLDATNTFDIINFIWLSLSQKMKDFGTQGQPVRFYVDPIICEYYNRGYKDEMGSVVYNNKWNQTQVLGSEGRAILLPMAAKSGSKWIQVTLPGNMLFGTGSKGQMESITVDRIPPFDVMMSGTMWAGCQYRYIDPTVFMAVKTNGVKTPVITDFVSA